MQNRQGQGLGGGTDGPRPRINQKQLPVLTARPHSALGYRPAAPETIIPVSRPIMH